MACSAYSVTYLRGHVVCPASDITMYRGRGACPAYDRASFRESVLFSAFCVAANGEGVLSSRSTAPLYRRRGDRRARPLPRQRCVITQPRPTAWETIR